MADREGAAGNGSGSRVRAEPPEPPEAPEAPEAPDAPEARGFRSARSWNDASAAVFARGGVGAGARVRAAAAFDNDAVVAGKGFAGSRSVIGSVTGPGSVSALGTEDAMVEDSRFASSVGPPAATDFFESPGDEDATSRSIESSSFGISVTTTKERDAIVANARPGPNHGLLNHALQPGFFCWLTTVLIAADASTASRAIFSTNASLAADGAAAGICVPARWARYSADSLSSCSLDCFTAGLPAARAAC